MLAVLIYISGILTGIAGVFIYQVFGLPAGPKAKKILSEDETRGPRPWDPDYVGGE